MSLQRVYFPRTKCILSIIRHYQGHNNIPGKLQTRYLGHSLLLLQISFSYTLTCGIIEDLWSWGKTLDVANSVRQHLALTWPPHDVVTRWGGGLRGGGGGEPGWLLAHRLFICSFGGVRVGRKTSIAGIVQQIAGCFRDWNTEFRWGIQYRHPTSVAWTGDGVAGLQRPRGLQLVAAGGGWTDRPQPHRHAGQREVTPEAVHQRTGETPGQPRLHRAHPRWQIL